MKVSCLLPVSLSALILAGSIADAQNITVGKFACKFAPESLNNRTIRVDGNMVAMSEEFHIPPEASSSDAPSIFFIIDNSGSMVGTNGTDRNGNRFIVTSALLDTLQKNYPDVEVGLSVFGTTLFFDPSDKPYFVTCPGQQGGYVPFLQLGKTYPAYGNITGYAILKEILATNNGNLTYMPTNTVFGGNRTNITAGFDAARNAFLSSVNSADHRKQFIIFFSDGEANIPGTTNPDDSTETFRFTLGTNIPTTFTVFFSTALPLYVPSTISTMITNIQGNGWSPNNPKSAYWGYQNTSQAALMDFLMTNVLPVMTSSIRLQPKGVSLGGATTTSWVDGHFIFPALFQLTGTVTPFSFSVTYSMYDNSVFIKDTVHSITNLNIQIDPARTLPADSFDVRHWTRNLKLRNNNMAVSTVTGSMDSLELQFDYNPGTALYKYTNVSVQLYNQLGTIMDNETFTLNKQADTFFVKFRKVVSTLPVPGNGIFETQGLAGDSLVAVFRNSENPLLPLDTLRIAIPITLSQNFAVYRDGAVSALPNSLELSSIQKAGSITITAGLPSTCTTGAFTLFTISGKKLAERTISGPGLHTLTFPNIPAGVHFLRLYTGGKTIIRKALCF